MNKRILHAHFESTRSRIIAASRQIDVANHGTIKGLLREILIHEFLETHLPKIADFVSGEILDIDDNRSGQIDLIVQAKSSPRVSLTHGLCISFADSVTAVIEVKSQIRSKADLGSTLDQISKVKGLKREHAFKDPAKINNPENSSGIGRFSELKNIPCVLVCYRGLRPQTMEEGLCEYQARVEKQPNEFAPNLIVCLERDYSLSQNDGWIVPRRLGGGPFLLNEHQGGDSLTGLFIFLNNLIQCHYHDPNIVHLGEYLPKVDLGRT